MRETIELSSLNEPTGRLEVIFSQLEAVIDRVKANVSEIDFKSKVEAAWEALNSRVISAALSSVVAVAPTDAMSQQSFPPQFTPDPSIGRFISIHPRVNDVICKGVNGHVMRHVAANGNVDRYKREMCAWKRDRSIFRDPGTVVFFRTEAEATAYMLAVNNLDPSIEQLANSPGPRGRHVGLMHFPTSTGMEYDCRTGETKYLNGIKYIAVKDPSTGHLCFVTMFPKGLNTDSRYEFQLVRVRADQFNPDPNTLRELGNRGFGQQQVREYIIQAGAVIGAVILGVGIIYFTGGAATPAVAGAAGVALGVNNLPKTENDSTVSDNY